MFRSTPFISTPSRIPSCLPQLPFVLILLICHSLYSFCFFDRQVSTGPPEYFFKHHTLHKTIKDTQLSPPIPICLHSPHLSPFYNFCFFDCQVFAGPSRVFLPAVPLPASHHEVTQLSHLILQRGVPHPAPPVLAALKVVVMTYQSYLGS